MVLLKRMRDLVWCLAVSFSALIWANEPQFPNDAAVSGYVLGADDQIAINVLEGLDLGDKRFLIGTDGALTLPLIGRVQAAGLTVQGFENEIISRLKVYVKDPQVSVTVTEFRSQPVFVLGAVTTPGAIQLRGHKTLYEVLTLAGGPTDKAGVIISIVRLSENGPLPLPDAQSDPTGHYTTARVDLQQILDGKNPSVNIEIRPHDVISVSQGAERMVYVVGDVQHAGAFNVGGRHTLSVLAALSMAGGLGHTAKPDRAIILRPLPNGQAQQIAVNIKEILSGKREDIGLRPEDVLVVPTSSRKVFNAIVTGTLAGVVSAAIYAGATH